MAIAFDAASHSRGSSISSLTFAHTCTGTLRALVVAAIGDSTSDVITGATYAGVSMTLVDKVKATGGRWNYLFYLNAPATGANNVVITGSTPLYIEGNAASYTGVLQTGQPEASNTGSNAGAGSLAVAVTTTTDNAWVVCAALGTSGTITAGSGTTLRATDLVGAALDSGGAVTPAGSKTININQASSNIISGVVAALAPDTTPTDSITLTDVDNYRVVQRSGTTGSLTIAGSHSGGATSVQARIVLHGTSTEVKTWTTIDASPGASTFSGTLTGIDQGSWYNVQVRWGNDTAVTSEGSNRFGVGCLVLVIGQSQATRYFSEGTAGSPDSALVQYDGTWALRTTTGNGANALGNSLRTALGSTIPVALLKYGVGATALDTLANGGAGYWMNTAGGSPYALALAGVNATGGKLEAIAWMQGEQDGYSTLVSEALYQSDLETFVAQWRTALSQSSLPFIVSPLGRYTNAGPTDASWQGIQNALATVGGQTNNTLSATVADLALTDGVHYTTGAYTTHGTRLGRAVRAALGLSAYAKGPTIASASAPTSTTVAVVLTPGGGTDFTPTTGITGFEVIDNGSPATVSGAVRTSATVITLTVSAPLAGPTTVRYLYGTNPTVSAPVLDNTSETLPLQGRDSLAVSTQSVKRSLLLGVG